MNYRHIYHAGNFADVFKHWVLTLLMDKLVEKNTPFFALDTHAGLGWYNLDDKSAQKTQESSTGIKAFLNNTPNDYFQSYLKIVKESMQLQQLYPGSSAIIQHYLRDEDRLWCAELHPEDYLVLQHNFAGDRRIRTLNQSGYQQMRALLPPQQGRGLVFIDPPFEEKTEHKKIVESLQAALLRFAHGMYAIWYPIKDIRATKWFYLQLKKMRISKAMYIEFHSNNIALGGLQSCGMICINPPWQLEEKLNSNLPHLLNYLNLTQGSFAIENLGAK